MKVAPGLIALAALALLVLAVTPFVGMTTIPFSALADGTGGNEATIFWDIRVPRVVTAYLAGAGLALAGLVFQAMFRNPLATPFTLGVASGASLGAALGFRFGFAVALGSAAVVAPAFLGALVAIGLVYGLTRLRHGFSTATMLLAGVAVNFFFSSLILFVQYTTDYMNSFRLLRWLMGGLNVFGFGDALVILPFVIAGAVLVAYQLHELDLLVLGDDWALSRGVAVSRTKTLLFLAASLLVAGVVAVCGPIAFVGLMAPHICRLLLGPSHRVLVPATLLFGGAFLAVCDTFARTIFAPLELPVGVVTAFLGGPFFLWLLLRGNAERMM